MRIAELTNLKNNQNNKGDNRPNTFIRLKELGGKDKKIDNILKCYLKCVYRGLTGINNKILARAYVSFVENNAKSPFDLKDREKYNPEFYNLFFGNMNETFDQYFKNKVLYSLLQKYKRENLNREEVDKTYQNARRDLQLIHWKFMKNLSKTSKNKF